MNKAQFAKKKEQIKENYGKVHNILFTYARIIFTVFFWILILVLIFLNKIEKEDDSQELQRQLNSQKFINRVREKDNDRSLKWPISFWQYEEEWTNITSFSNLLYYKGFIIPRFFSISKTVPFQPIEYFNQWTYTIQELDTLFKNIFIASNKNYIPKLTNTSFAITTIGDDFNINCFLQPKLLPTICNSFLSKFLDSFFIYNIEIDSDNFSKIMEKALNEKKFRDRGCKWMMYYIYYKGSDSESIKYLMKQCPSNYQDEYNLYINFLEIENELFSKFITNKIYKEDELNIYKLISYQQIINDDINNKMIDVDRINRYFSFLQELLKKDKMPQFYKELSYYFNNYYVRRAIEDIEITNKIPNKTDVDTMARQIIDINNGNLLIWYQWLKDQVNKNILRADINTSYSWTTISYERKIESLLLQIGNLKIRRSTMSWNIISVQWSWYIKMDLKEIDTNVTFILEENNNTLYIQQATFDGFVDINQAINKALKETKRTFFELQRFLEQNLSLFNEATPPLSKEQIDKICKDIKDTLITEDIKECNNSRVIITFLRKNRVTTMTIQHYNFSPDKFDVSNTEAKELLDLYLEYISKNTGWWDAGIFKRLATIDYTNFTTFIKETLENLPNAMEIIKDRMMMKKKHLQDQRIY
jgi:hypothetical protein